MSNSESDRGSGSSNDIKDIGTSIILMAVPIDVRPRSYNNIEFRFSDDVCRFKEHLATTVAKKFGVMPNCDIRSPNPEDWMLQARESLLFLSTPLRPGLGGLCIPFLLDLWLSTPCARGN